jgi:hypothetical protein
VSDEEDHELASDQRADEIMRLAEWYRARWGYAEMNSHILDRARETHEALAAAGLLAAQHPTIPDDVVDDLVDWWHAYGSLQPWRVTGAVLPMDLRKAAQLLFDHLLPTVDASLPDEPSDETIERAAEASWNDWWRNVPDHTAWSNVTKAEKDEWRSSARAALAAMKEKTDG